MRYPFQTANPTGDSHCHPPAAGTQFVPIQRALQDRQGYSDCSRTSVFLFNQYFPNLIYSSPHLLRGLRFTRIAQKRIQTLIHVFPNGLCHNWYSVLRQTVRSRKPPARQELFRGITGDT